MQISRNRPKKGVNNIWYHFTDSDTAIVFVHGIFSDSNRCWYYEDKEDSSLNRYWPNFILDDKRLENPSVFLGGFYTEFNSKTYSIEDCANELLQGLRTAAPDSTPPPLSKNRLIFICHSTGGIVTRSVLVNNVSLFANKDVGLFLVASPSYGSKWADKAKWAAMVTNHKLGKQLKWGSESLENLDRQFRRMQNENTSFKLSGIEAYENRFIRKFAWIFPCSTIVTKESANRYFDATQLPDTDHFSSVKPSSMDHCSHKLFVEFYTNRFNAERGAGNYSQVSLRGGTIAGHFRRLVVDRHRVFNSSQYLLNNPGRKCIGPIISVKNLRGISGVPGDMLVLEEIAEELQFPPYVKVQIGKTQVSGRDGNKAALRWFNQLPLDANSGLSTLGVSRTKYRTKLAMREVKKKIHDDLIHERLRIVEDNTETVDDPAPVLPCHLHCDSVVITGDRKILLAQRSGGVDIDKFEWAASFGESIEWDDDRGTDGKLHPVRTLWRGLEEELGLPEHWVVNRFGNNTKITFLELGFQTDSLIYILFSIIELPQLMITEALDRALHCRTDGETKAFDSMDFTPSKCATAVVTGVVDGKKLNYAGRFGLLLASLNKFYTSFMEELVRMS